ANVLLERIFSPKEFDAPLATVFVNLKQGTRHTFVFELPVWKKGYFVRIYRNSLKEDFNLEKDITFKDVPLRLNQDHGNFTASLTLEELGHYDYLVYRKERTGNRWQIGKGVSGRINVISDIRGEIVLEIFPDIHGHTRIYWGIDDGRPGLVYNENGEIIRTGRFSDITAHLEDLKKRYQITALYLLGVQKRGNNRSDWAPEATSPSPFSPVSLTEIEPSLGGDTEFRELIAEAHKLNVKVIVDIIPHVNRKSEVVPADYVVKCYDDGGTLVERASTDGRYGSWNDGKLLNYRKFEIWRWLAQSILTLIDRYDIDGIRFDSAHAVPIMMKKNNYPYYYNNERSHEEMVEGSIIVNDREDNHFITTGYFDSACRDLISSPFHYYIMQAIERKIRRKNKKFFIHLAECFWGRERFLSRTGIVPYNSALFKICEKIIHGQSDVREIYHIYDEYFPSSLSRGTELLGILGNHDERRALNTFGLRGLRAAVALTCFISNIVMDYEGSAEGEGWKVYLDNIYVNWNQFEQASHRSLESFYNETFSFHRETREKGFLIWANNTMVAGAIKFTEKGIWLGAFNFSDMNQFVSLQFDNPNLPIKDSDHFRVIDPVYSHVTGMLNYFTGEELKVSKIHTVVPYTDRVKLLKLELVEKPQEHYNEFLRDSFYRLCDIDKGAHFRFNFAFNQIAASCDTLDRFSSFFYGHLFPLFWAQDRQRLELGLKRAFYHIYKNTIIPGKRLLECFELLTLRKEEEIKEIGMALKRLNEYRPLVFISAEAEPFSKSGGLANVVYELPRELRKLGERVYVITPLYHHGAPRAADKMQQAVKRYGITYTGKNVRFRIREVEYEVGVHSGTVDGIVYYLLDHHEFFDGLYWGYTGEEKLRRRIAFARASAEVIQTFGLKPNFTLTNDAYSGLFNGIVRCDPRYGTSDSFQRNTFLHIIHNGGWQYFDSFFRFDGGQDLFHHFNLPDHRAWEFCDPKVGHNLNCMAAGIRFADRVITVSPSYAKQIEISCDGLEVLLHDVIGINNALGYDFHSRALRKLSQSLFIETHYPRFLKLVEEDSLLRAKLESRFPEILESARSCEGISNRSRREMLVRMRNKLLLQVQHRLTVDPDRVLCIMIHRIAEQKGFQLFLEASEGIVKKLGLQAIIGGQVASGDLRGEELARGLMRLKSYYPESLSVHVGFQEVEIPLLCSDVFLMPSMHEPGGISQLEAMACGCLVVARATGGLRDTVEPLRIRGSRVTGNGFLFSDFTPSSLYDALNRCASFFREAELRQIHHARLNAQKSVYYWDYPARRYIEETYEIKEIIRCV
ncbi:MAG TPA: glycogen/starch synthase, partial [Spirochaetia bacterium]|nr:glycogen/starch synthase [Spirochaetia bacterium]